jgi:hypothetical protein
MAHSRDASSPLVVAAETLEEELGALDQLATRLERSSISSEKTLQRSATLLQEAGHIHERLGASVVGLGAAITSMQARQQVLLERVLVETRRLESRNKEYQELMQRFAALGERAREVNGPVGEVVAQKGTRANPEALLEALGKIEQLASSVAADAESVVSSARSGDWPEVARGAQALKQTMEAAVNKLVLAKREIAAHAAS